ncbi:uncharacterized protein LOC114050004 isoform X2 [Vombatus ursinus]|uniref:uncharacterized protein LOC114050004 isoform X2 n=1 Tax=Vombatus ursinus TaxID=29139 RepID=UPI000FFDA566|nr:uncharacterized protein LOC114050004 isoform X2 [Vombatus ursinus]
MFIRISILHLNGGPEFAVDIQVRNGSLETRSPPSPHHPSVSQKLYLLIHPGTALHPSSLAEGSCHAMSYVTVKCLFSSSGIPPRGPESTEEGSWPRERLPNCVADQPPSGCAVSNHPTDVRADSVFHLRHQWFLGNICPGDRTVPLSFLLSLSSLGEIFPKEKGCRIHSSQKIQNLPTSMMDTSPHKHCWRSLLVR